MFAAIRRWLGVDAAGAALAGRPRIALGPGDRTVIYAIGDVHGCLDLLIDAEARIRADHAAADVAAAAPAPLILLLGDLVDRGPRSAGVIDHLLAPPPAGFRRMALCGNHDAAFLDFIRAPAAHLGWLGYGGVETLRSYGIDADYLLTSGSGAAALGRTVTETVPQSHVDFLAGLPVLLATPTHVFVHAGILPGRPLDEQEDRDLMWIRSPFLEEGPGLPVTVVHGHTPVRAPEFGNGRIGLDTGAYATGRLSVLRVDGGNARLL